MRTIVSKGKFSANKQRARVPGGVVFLDNCNVADEIILNATILNTSAIFPVVEDLLLVHSDGNCCVYTNTR